MPADEDTTSLAGAPIAIVGVGCRLPGGIRSPEEFWRLLVGGGRAHGEVPTDRWAPYAAGGFARSAAVRRAVRFGSFLDDIAGFDAAFFGISPREAELMDPQQRVTLEVTWEALEHAGIPPHSLAGGDGAVFMGVCCDDYGRRLLEDLPHVEAWTGIGSSLCGVSNRVSYALDLRGPSVSVDTACSASLVALHQACQALRLGETPIALAGGVMLAASPSFSLVLDAAGAISPDGRSKAFDASADGYGRGEGCAVLVLKRLDDARRDGDRVLAVIRGSAVCQDGRTDGIMAPSQRAQEHLLRRACRNAGIDPLSVDYVEAHGTGTRVGDPIEVGALSAVVGSDRPEGRPCLIGSVKTNIGHLEAASGVAGVIKVVLALGHGVIPATLTTSGLREDIPWADSGLRVVTENTAWPEVDRPRRTGVGNYGYGGTIAHVVLEQAPAQEHHVDASAHGRRLYPLSSASEDSVRAQAGRLADWLPEHPDVPVADVGHSLAHRRSPLDVRATVVAADRTELVERLRRLARGEPTVGVGVGHVARTVERPGVVWVFSGHGAQWVGMGRDLMRTEPVFGETLDELEPVFGREAGISPRRVLLDGDFEEVGRAQLMIFAMQVGLSRVWQRYGVRPTAVIGHSVGEVAAAVCAGALDLTTAARLMCHRSRLLRRVAGRGAMMMVPLPFDQVHERLAGRADVSAAISASLTSTVVSGERAAVGQIAAQWRADGVPVRQVDSDVAFHSAAMDPLLADLVAAVGDLRPSQPQIPLYATALDDPRAQPFRDADYWAANLRNPVQFADAVRAAVEDGHHRFVEISAHPVVAHSISETVSALGIEDGIVAHTLRRNAPEQETLLDNVGALHRAGIEVDWAALQPVGGLADLPTTAWQHRRHWVDAPPVANTAFSQHDVDSHTLLGGATTVHGSSPLSLWQATVDFPSRPYVGEHEVLGTEVIPAAVVLATFLDAAKTTSLTDVSLRAPLPLTAPREVQVVLQDGGLRLNSRLIGDESWLTNASATVDTREPDLGVADVDWLCEQCPEEMQPGHVIDRLRSVGVNGIGFPWRVDKLRRGKDVLVATVTAAVGPGGDTWASIVDAALSVAPVIFPGPVVLRMPGEFAALSLVGAPPATALLHARLVSDPVDVDIAEVDIDLLTDDGTVIGMLTGVRFGAVERNPTTETAGDPVVSQAWRDLTGPDLGVHLVEEVRSVVATELRITPGELDVRRPLPELGLDSLMSAVVRQRLTRQFTVELPATLLWNHSTVQAIGGYLAELLAAQCGEAVS